MPRSGSTLVEQILASHPSVLGGGESEAFRNAVRATGFHTPSLAFPESIPDWTDKQFDELANRYLRQLNVLASTQKSHAHPTHVTDKMPVNFLYVGLIHLALPHARIIHTCRDPIDTCLSCFSLLFEKQFFTYDLGELGRYYQAYQLLMRHWRSVPPPGVMLDVRYANLVANPETEVRRILAHCGLDWSEACLRFHETSRAVRTASVVQVRQPIYQTSVRRWRPDARILRPA